MISRYEATLNGISLSSLHPNILIVDTASGEPGRKLETYNIAHRDGGRVRRNYKEKATATIQFLIRSYDIVERQNICQDVCRWAKRGGMLRLNDRQNQYLLCECTTFPTIASAKNWTNALTIAFTSLEVPYWQSVSPSKTRLAGASGSGKLYVPGSAPKTVVGAEITANSALNNISLTVGETTLNLTGINVPAGEKIVVGYDNELILSIKHGDTSLLSHRTGADDLIAECDANNNVSFTANAECTVEFVARGMWE